MYSFLCMSTFVISSAYSCTYAFSHVYTCTFICVCGQRPYACTCIHIERHTYASARELPCCVSDQVQTLRAELESARRSEAVAAAELAAGAAGAAKLRGSAEVVI